MTNSVYINATGTFFPNKAVDNDNIEKVLGMIRERPSKSRTVVLNSNQIKTRYYAIDPETRKSTHTVAELTVEAIQNLLQRHPEISVKDTEILACGTTVPDLIIPAHGQMVQGLLKDFSGEVFTSAGVCCSSMSALKTAYLSILSNDATSALVTGTESASKFMRSEFFESESEVKVGELQKNPMVAFEHDFLRWMLSDGAGAFYLSNRAIPGKVNLKMNWIDGKSYANEQAVCMYAGGYQEDDGNVIDWKTLRLLEDEKKSRFAMNFRQDIRQLRENILLYTVERRLTELKKKRGLRAGDYSWFLPHYSSDFFRPLLVETLKKIDFEIPSDRWFTTLYDTGNIGSASMFSFVDRLVRTKELSKGEKILCFIPESARFSAYYIELEVV